MKNIERYILSFVPLSDGMQISILLDDTGQYKKKHNYRSISFMNMDSIILNKTLANLIH